MIFDVQKHVNKRPTFYNIFPSMIFFKMIDLGLYTNHQNAHSYTKHFSKY